MQKSGVALTESDIHLFAADEWLKQVGTGIPVTKLHDTFTEVAERVALVIQENKLDSIPDMASPREIALWELQLHLDEEQGELELFDNGTELMLRPVSDEDEDESQASA